MNNDDLVNAIRFCRAEDCENCPAQREICDQLRVDMEELPMELVDRVIEALEKGT